MSENIKYLWRKSTLYLFLLLSTGLSQVDFFGYMETDYDWLEVKESSYGFGYNKLRLDYESYPVENVSIRGNINFQLYHGKTSWDALDFFPFDTLNNNGDPVTTIPITFSDNMFLDNVYLATTFSGFDFTIGKQPISLGSGYAWNPLDIFNRKELVDPTYEQPGVNALRLEYYITGNLSADFIYSPDTNFTKPKVMIQLKSQYGSFDYSLNAAYKYHLYPYWEDAIAVSTHKRTRFIGGSIAGEMSDYGIWGEALWSLSSTDSQGEISLGIDHTFDNGL